MPAILEDAARQWPERTALHFMGRDIAYAELDRLADRMAAGLQRLGVGPGVHVGIYLPNTPHYFIAFFGILKAGGTVVNYSPLDAEAVLEHKGGGQRNAAAGDLGHEGAAAADAAAAWP
ncbi:MAG: AMP-binding protein [Rhodospirillales bacterium]